jgi:hypothetical protein
LSEIAELHRGGSGRYKTASAAGTHAAWNVST